MKKTFQEFDTLLQGRNHASKKLANHTYAQRTPSGAIAIRLHQTEIVTFNPDGSITATTGGYKTHTTKDRLNQYLPTTIHQHRGCWTLSSNGEVLEFADGLTFHPDGTITGAKSKSDQQAEAELQKRIANYCHALKAALPLPMPGNGDCWHCLMRETKSNLPLGEAVKDTSHLESHFEEKYFVPSLVWRALEFSGCQPNGGGCAWFAYAFGKLTLESWNRNKIASMVRKYLRRQFKLA